MISCGIKFVCGYKKPWVWLSIPSLREIQASWEIAPLPVHKLRIQIRLLFQKAVHFAIGYSHEWVTGISIRLNWVVESACDCLLHFPRFWSIVIHYQDLSAILFFLCFIKALRGRTRSVLAGSFHCASFCISSPNQRAVKFNYRTSFNTEGNYGAGFIAVNSTSCQRSSHTAVTQLQFGHIEIALNRAIISIQWQFSSPLFVLSGCY